MHEDVEAKVQAYGCLNLVAWVVVAAIAGLVAAQFLGERMGWVAALLVVLACVVGGLSNARRAIEGARFDESMRH